MDPKRQMVDVYNLHAAGLAEKFNGIGSRVPDIERAFALVEKKDPMTLEIGCGNGRDASEIVKRTNQYLGIDISEGMIALAREAVPGAAFEVQDVETAAFPDGLDLVFAFASLVHSPPEAVKDVLARLAKALHPGGVVYLSLKYGDGPFVKTDAFGSRLFYFYTPETIKTLAGEAYVVVYEHIYDLRGVKWMDVALRLT